MNISIAGLLHDLGHGAHSHTFQRVIEKLEKDSSKDEQSKWSHEKASGMLLNHIIDEQSIDFEQSDINIICDIISGKKLPIGNEKCLINKVGSIL